MAGAIYTELRKPPEQRTWHGQLLDTIPYDFRLPTLERLSRRTGTRARRRCSPHRPLGVGWAINIPTALRRIGVHTSFTKGR